MAERLVSETGIPSAKRGRRGGNVDLTPFAKDIENLQKNLGTAYGYPDTLPKVGRALKAEYGVSVKFRDVDPKDSNKGVMWLEWPSFEDDEGNLVEDTEQVQDNLEA